MARFVSTVRRLAAAGGSLLVVGAVSLVALNCATMATAADPGGDGQLWHDNRSTGRMLPGIAEPAQLVAMAAPLTGVLAELHVREGASVKQGEVLAVMDDRVAQAAVRAAALAAEKLSEIEQARIGLAMAKQYHRRVARAHQHKAASDLELDEAQGRVDKAQATLELARELRKELEARMALEQARLDTHRVTAPFDGRVVAIKGKIGESLDVNDSLLTIANLRSLRVELNLPIRWLNNVEIGTSYPLAAEAPVRRTLMAKLVWYEPMIDAATHTFRCVFEIENQDESLPAGFVVRLAEPQQELRAANARAGKPGSPN